MAALRHRRVETLLDMSVLLYHTVKINSLESETHQCYPGHSGLCDPRIAGLLDLVAA